MKPVVIFAATRWELRAVQRAFARTHVLTIAGHRFVVSRTGGRTYWLVRTGIGPDAAGRVAAAVVKAQPVDSILSAGFVCALGPARIGDLLIGLDVTAVGRTSEWVVLDGPLCCDEELRSRMVTIARGAGLSVATGPIISVPAVIGAAEDKRVLSRFSGALGLDMESAALGRAAADSGVPFGIVRTVSDLRDEDLPVDFNLFLRPGGWLTGARSLLVRRGSLTGLNRLRKQSRVAADNLTRWFRAWADGDVAGSKAVAGS